MYKQTINIKLNIAQSAGAVEYTDCTSAEGYDTKQCSSDARALGNVERSFIAVASRSTLAWCGSIR